MIFFAHRYHSTANSIKALCIALLIMGLSNNLALAADPVKPLARQANQRALAHHPTWLRLLHYEETLLSTHRLSSAIHSSEFFISDNGRFSPEEELEATIAALTAEPESNPNTHAQCRFRARYLWLREMLPLLEKRTPTIHCDDFIQWSLGAKPDSISIVFATGFLNNPASYYGHTLIKINSQQVNGQLDLLDQSVNFGAIVPDGHGPVRYIFNSLIGGYDAGFTHINYYFHTHNYGEIEQRDLWEYELALNARDTALVVAHLWELLGKKYTYYFFNKNCASRMAEVLQIIEGIDVMPDNPVWVIPQTLVQKLLNARYQGAPLVRQIEYHPSRQARFYHKYNSLEAGEQAQIAAIAADTRMLEEARFDALALADKHRVLDTLLDYFQYTREPEQAAQSAQQQAYQKILAKRFMLPAGPEQLTPTPAQSPAQSRPIGLVQLASASNQRRGSGTLLTIRPAYYDELDADSGQVAYAGLTMGRIELAQFGDDAPLLRNLQILSVESRNVTATGLPGDDRQSWQLDIGWRRQHLACSNNCLSAYISADKGYVWPLGDKLFGAGYLGVSAQDNRNNQGNFYLGGQLLLMGQLSQQLNFRLSYHLRQHIDENLGEEYRLAGQLRYAINRRWDLRAAYANDQAEEFSLGLGYYW